MGLNANSIKLLFEARAAGVSFARTATLGRQFLACAPAILDELMAKFDPSGSRGGGVRAANEPFADRFFKSLGAHEIVAVDYSAYEGAEIVHDMNQPIPAIYYEQFDTVIDGGTLEHVFNYPVAIKNAMDMVKCGGHLVLITPINNFCGHGFYQFSPELFFRLLTAANGFRVNRAVLWEERVDPIFYHVDDPALIGRRVELASRYPVLLMIQAEKTAPMAILKTPQQSDYSAIWNGESTVNVARRAGWITTVKRNLIFQIFTRFPRFSTPLRRMHRWLQVRATSLQQEPGFRRIGRLASHRRNERISR